MWLLKWLKNNVTLPAHGIVAQCGIHGAGVAENVARHRRRARWRFRHVNVPRNASMAAAAWRWPAYDIGA